MRRARTIRNLRNKSLSDVLRDTGIDKGQLSKFERGSGDEALLGSATLKRLASYYGVSIDELLREDKVPVA